MLQSKVPIEFHCIHTIFFFKMSCVLQKSESQNFGRTWVTNLMVHMCELSFLNFHFCYLLQGRCYVTGCNLLQFGFALWSLCEVLPSLLGGFLSFSITSSSPQINIYKSNAKPVGLSSKYFIIHSRTFLLSGAFDFIPTLKHRHLENALHHAFSAEIWNRLHLSDYL